jgi:hypothetical protein
MNMKTNANTNTLVSRQLKDPKTPLYALQLAAKKLGLDEPNPEVNNLPVITNLIIASRLSDRQRHVLVIALRRASSAVHGVPADRVVFEPSVTKANPTAAIPPEWGLLLDENGSALKRSKVQSKSKAKKVATSTCKCKYCGGGVDELTFKINKGACHKPKCVLAAMREHL